MTEESLPPGAMIIKATDGSTIINPVQIAIYRRPPPDVPFQVPRQYAAIVERPEISERLKTSLLSDEDSLRGSIVNVIHGLGGVGKSTLAAAMAYDPQVQQRFPDAILWVTLGHDPDLLALLSGWIQALKDYDAHLTTPEAASSHLRTLLNEKAAMLIVDDAWDVRHAELFLVGGDHCRIIITTRDALIATATRANLYSLDVMTIDQAIALLATCLKRPLQGEEAEQARQLALEVGHLPLALEIAAAQIADGISWVELVDDLHEEIARLEALDRPGSDEYFAEQDEATGKRLSLRASLQLSLKRLSLRATLQLSLKRLPEDKLPQFAWLGVLREDTTILPAMAAILWDTKDERNARDTLRYLRNKALLQPGLPALDGTQTYRVHDLIHQLARRLLIAPITPQHPSDLPGLNFTLPQAHRQLLNRYQERTQNGLWHTLRDDGYIHEQLLWHMVQAEREEDIPKLLCEETPAGQNGWYTVREQLGQTVGYLQDINRAWELAHAYGRQKIEQNERMEGVGLEMRYALMMSSIHSLAGHIPTTLLVALVRQNVRFRPQGLAFARQMPYPWDQAHALTGIALCLPEPDRVQTLIEALAAIRKIRGESWQLRALTDIVPHLKEPGQVQEALDIALEIADESYRAEALGTVVIHLPKPLPEQTLTEILAAIRTMPYELNRLHSLQAIAPHLVGPGQVQKALDIAREIATDGYRAQAMASLAAYLPEPLQEQILTEALDIAYKYGGNYYRSAVQDTMALHLMQSGQVQEPLDIAREIASGPNKNMALVNIALQLAQSGQLQEAVDAACDIQGDSRAKTVASIAMQLTQTGIQEALDIARTVVNDDYRAELLTAIAPHLVQSAHILQALEIARAIAGISTRVEALEALRTHLPEPLLEQALTEALAATRTIDDGYWRTRALIDVAAFLARSGQVQEALDIARNIQDGYSVAAAIEAIAPHLVQSGHIQQALDIARAIAVSMEQARALGSIAAQLAQSGNMPEALDITRTIAEESCRTQALTTVAPHLAQSDQVQEALDIARNMKDDGNRVQAMAAVAMHFPEPQREQALKKMLDAARKIAHIESRAGALATIATYLPEPQRERTLEKALDATRKIADVESRVQTLMPIALQIAQSGHIQRALAETGTIADADRRNKALFIMVNKLVSSGHLQEARATAQAISELGYKQAALAAIATDMAESGQVQEASDLARGIKDYPQHFTLTATAKQLAQSGQIQEALTIIQHFTIEDRAKILAAAAPALMKESRHSVYSLWSSYLRELSIGDRSDLFRTLRPLVSIGVTLDDPQSVSEILHAIQDVVRWWP